VDENGDENLASFGAVAKSAIVIGAGVGGLACALHLARAGAHVHVFERAASVGGKLAEVEVGGEKLLTGPSVLTMPAVFDALFDGLLADYVTLVPVEPLCRHFFADGATLDLFSDERRSHNAIRQVAGARDADGYLRFRKHAAKIHSIVQGPFMERAVPSLFDFMSPRALLSMMRIDGMRTLARALEDFFTDPRLRQLFGRYATYNGSSPYHAPATLAVIAHVENAYGVFSVAGGIVRLAEAMRRRAEELGVTFSTGAEVERIVVDKAGSALSAVGVRVAGAVERADAVFANCEIADALGSLISDVPAAKKSLEKYRAEELSLSAYLLLTVGAEAPFPLAHHNVFFSRDYRREFAELIDARRPPEEPTVYACAEDHQRLYFLSNAPPLDERGRLVDWNEEGPRCRARIERVLARHGWTLSPRATREVTPRDFAARFPSSQGALYGLSSNSRMAAFKRPSNVLPGVHALYFCGGSVHPGAGMPMVVLSARIAAQQWLTDQRSL
jgi:1-hydroxycarotenoid 3,4-desaturase